MDLICALRLFKNIPLSDAIQTIRRMGFKGVELDWESAKRQRSTNIHWLKEIHTHLIDSGLELAAINLATINAEREDQVNLEVREIKNNLQVISEIGSPIVILTGGSRTLENFNCLGQSLRLLSASASQYEMTLAVANELDTRIENLQDMAALFSADLPANVGLCLDVHHFHRAAVNTGDAIREQAKRIKMVRISDMMGTLPVVPGQGEIEIKALVRTLRREKFNGLITLDHLPVRLEKPEREIKQAYDYLQNIIC